MPPLLDETVERFLERLASDAPTPGGGSAAALAGALGASLLLMTCRLVRSRNHSTEERGRLDESAGRLEAIASGLKAAVDQDTESFDAVMAAMRLPRGTEAEKRARSEAIQAATRRATEVPLGVAERAAEALAIGEEIVGAINPNALSDLGSGVALLEAAMEGAAMNVRVNLTSIKDGAWVGGIRSRIESCIQAGYDHGERIGAFLAQEGLAAGP
jgi:formiminotetrahydrofolate cyclodeaminase